MRELAIAMAVGAVPDVWFRPEVVLAYALMPISLHVLLIMPRYYKSIIGHPLIAKMVQRGYVLSNRNKCGQEIESCDWVEIIGDVSSATTKLV